MCARDELRHIIWQHHDVWRNIYQHNLWRNIYRDNVSGHDYADVYVHHDGCSGTCAYDDVYVLDYYNGVNDDGRGIDGR